VTAPPRRGGPARPGTVVANRRRRFAVRADDGAVLDCVTKGRSLALACGDRVDFVATDGGGVIEAAHPRTSLFYRSDAFREKLIAANVTQVLGVVAPDVAVDEELVHRWIVAAEEERCRFVLVANKSDVPHFGALAARLAPFAALGYPVVPLCARSDVGALVPWLDGERSVLIGQSGMGKSTILNALVPEAAARTTAVSTALGAGRHTTTHTTLYMLPAPREGWIVDSPGMKVFGLAHIAPEAIAEAFVEMRPLLGHCRFRDCRHDAEPGCALRDAAHRGDIAPHRLALLRTLVAESFAARTPGR